MIIHLILKNCPWCDKIPDVVMPIDDHENSEQTWLWFIQCRNSCCKMNPKTPHVSIRKTTKSNSLSLVSKLDNLQSFWNEGNPMKATHKKIIDISSLLKKV